MVSQITHGNVSIVICFENLAKIFNRYISTTSFNTFNHLNSIQSSYKLRPSQVGFEKRQNICLNTKVTEYKFKTLHFTRWLRRNWRNLQNCGHYLKSRPRDEENNFWIPLLLVLQSMKDFWNLFVHPGSLKHSFRR